MRTRYLQMLKLYFIKSPMKRATYMREKGIFHSIGERVMIISRKIPLYAKLISIGNNVWIASGVEFITHDVTHYMLNGMKDGYNYTEKIGCIEIGNNVFIGADVKILYNVKIGDNVIIAAGALVNKDVPSNCVWGEYQQDSYAHSRIIFKRGDILLWNILRIMQSRRFHLNVNRRCGLTFKGELRNKDQ